MACMGQLTSEGQQQVTALAQRYGVSMEAVSTLLQALVHGHGTMAQFDHPELGGRGQWMPGGMVMVGDMFNQALKATVDGLCTELAALLAAFPLVLAAPARSPMASWAIPHQQQGSGRATAGTQAPAAGSWGSASRAGEAGVWWPAELGMPAASGTQNAMRYAYFPAQRRLAIATHEHIWLYDTLDHQVSGVSQQQGPGSTVTFTSQHGVLEVTSLPLMASSGVGSSDAGSSASTPPAAARPPEFDMAAGQATDIVATLERLAELRDKGILSEEEFAAKKAELLRRL
jgi:putative oligomerization/nucleic acid binding protein